jgi:hypothetical protein
MDDECGGDRVKPMAKERLSDRQLIEELQEYLRVLQGHPSAEEMMATIVTPDFETGFIGGQIWTGLDGLRDFLSQRDGFFDEEHTIDELREQRPVDGQIEARTRLHFSLRRWEAPSPVTEEFTGTCCHTWRVRQQAGAWRVASQLVEGFADLNDSAERLFSTPKEGLKR